ncbi:nicotinamide mononucleotide deamidase-related protein YfaY [Zophobihabitans entericus]|uniref:CinA-like protein n=2 Tax=Zophobihabitans entericus TaxID=1635327 RepID=A0A6G9IDX3_9GAMM|nr:nicotinamide mononucleotide deamidase-related protein YfaY [Zophobihabitans entericus]
MRIEMLSTGDEVLYGQIVDTNSAWLSDFLFQQGFPITSRVTAGDNLNQLVDMLRERSKQNDVLIVNGGLGPTSDDLSALAAAMANNEELVEHAEWIAEMERYFAQRGRPMSPTNRKQAMLPKSATIINNPVGTACGFLVKLNGCSLFFTPGVPSEFKVMVKDEILPRLKQMFPNIVTPVCYRLTTLGRSESEIAAELESQLKLPENVDLGYRSAMPIIELKLTGPGTKQAEMEKVWQQLKGYVRDNTIYEGTVGLPKLVTELLTEKGLSLTVSEQYTAGLMAYQLYDAEAPLTGSEVTRNQQTSLVEYAKALRQKNHTDIALVLGDYKQEQKTFEVVLDTQQKTYHYQLKYISRIYSRTMLQDIFSTVALDMLRRHLSGLSLMTPNIWMEAIEL